LEDAGNGALAAPAIDEILAFLGNDYRRKLTPLAESRWAHGPFARGCAVSGCYRNGVLILR
jgi:monoamine oxidase